MIAARMMFTGGLFCVAGCSTVTGDFPSLAKRPVEDRVSLREPAILPPIPAAPADAMQRSAIGTAMRKVEDGNAMFRRELAKTQSLIAAGRGAPMGSDAWAGAQMAVSALEAARAASAEGLAEIDRLRVVSETLPDRRGLDEIVAARAAADAVVAAQSRDIRERAASLR